MFRLGGPIVGMGANSAIPTGILRSAVDATADIFSTKVSTVTTTAASQSEPVLELLSDADAAHRSLRAGMLAAVTELWQASEQGGRGTREQRAAVHGFMHYAGRVARDTISALYARSSRDAFFRGHPLERAMRNIHAVAYGLEPLRPFQHSAGLVRMGLRPTAPGF